MRLDDAKPVIFVNVPDRAAAQAFYRDTLALRLKSSDEYGDFYDLGGALLRVTPLPDFQPSPHPVLGFNLADIRAAMSALRSKGIAFAIYEGLGQEADGLWVAPDGTAKVAWFTDPFGNVLSLSETG